MKNPANPTPALREAALVPSPALEANQQVIETLRAALEDREALGQRIYRAMYENKGGDWRFNETKDVWFEIADRFIALTHPTQDEVK